MWSFRVAFVSGYRKLISKYYCWKRARSEAHENDCLSLLKKKTIEGWGEGVKSLMGRVFFRWRPWVIVWQINRGGWTDEMKRLCYSNRSKSSFWWRNHCEVEEDRRKVVYREISNGFQTLALEISSMKWILRRRESKSIKTTKFKPC